MNRSAEPFHTEQEYYKELIACVRLFLEDNPEQDRMKARAILQQRKSQKNHQKRWNDCLGIYIPCASVQRI